VEKVLEYETMDQRRYPILDSTIGKQNRRH